MKKKEQRTNFLFCKKMTLVSTKKKRKTPKTSISKGKIRMKGNDRNIEPGGRYVEREEEKKYAIA